MKQILLKKEIDWSKLSILLIAIVVIAIQLDIKYWNQKERVICWDVVSYYAYLPATFIYNDISLEFTENYNGKHEFVFWPSTAPNGGKVVKTSMGLSMLYSPFFFVGHFIALISDYDTGGYSAPYKLMIIISSLFYLLIGLIFLRKILLLYFSKVITTYTILLIFFATNLLYYSTFEASMSHVYSFCLITLFIWFTIKWHNKPSIKNTVILGLLSGIISLTRPTNSIIALVFIFYEITNLKDIKSRVNLFAKEWYKIAMLLLIVLLIWVPQFLYWKIITGSYFYFSYGSDEKFFFSDPQIVNGLFSYRKGWFVYTPIMFFAVLGFLFLKDKLKNYLLPFVLFLIINLYIVFSWWCWWYGGGFGQRSLIDSFAVMAIPLAAILVNFIQSKKRFVKKLSVGLILLFILHGIFQTVQYYHGAIHWDSMSKASYWDSFGRDIPSENFNKLLIAPDYEKAKEGER